MDALHLQLLFTRVLFSPNYVVLRLPMYTGSGFYATKLRLRYDGRELSNDERLFDSQYAYRKKTARVPKE